ncbi:glycoside hydrolase family 55 protein [Chryseobacterium sp. C-71]|uniref:glycoside hydrolase family 55 protein n=1 Tax=Chryseobacterium sp. C-71 TaxID=2893882 RepID=UPI001E4152A4|nr:glycoside hydrolase family 55 protein [Chryseobacterium sp. C-71]UFH33330.1 glycoside hydrolase family 55 protein [Chryseobacterium sp. C-71]
MMITLTDPYTKEQVNYYKIPFAEIDGNIDNVLYKEILNETTGITTYYKRAYTGSVSVKWFGAVGDGITDDTNAIETAIQSLNSRTDLKFSTLDLETGVYIISRSLTMLAGINLIGQGATKKVAVGGVVQNHSTILRWNGASNKTMLYLKNVSGITISGICFDTMTSPQDTDQTDISILGITAITYINRSITRYNEISNCMFNLLEVGIHYLDDKGDNPNTIDPSADHNMDTNYIDRCEFRYCVIGVKVEQTNVYNPLISRSAFYGSETYTKHHLLILKGHADISDSFLGPLKNKNSIGGRDGIAVEVNQGYCNLYNIYAEAHNGPFFVWKSTLNNSENCICNLISCNVVTEILTNPTTQEIDFPTNYLVENRTNKTLFVSGGFYTYNFSQKKQNGVDLTDNSKGGSIVICGTDTANVSPDSLPDRIIFYGNKYGNLPVVGSLADINNAGGGKLYITGQAVQLKLAQLPSFKSLTFDWSGDTLKIHVPDYYNNTSVEFNFAQKKMKMTGWTIEQ